VDVGVICATLMAVTFWPSNFYSCKFARKILRVFLSPSGFFFYSSSSTLALVWSPNRTAAAEGPHAGESGPRLYSSTQPVLVGQWAFFELMIKPTADFTAAVKVWINGQVLFDQSLVKMRYPDVGQGGWMYVQHTAYGGALTLLDLSRFLVAVIELARTTWLFNSRLHRSDSAAAIRNACRGPDEYEHAVRVPSHSPYCGGV